MSLKAVLFDLDDTLYRERTYVESGFMAVAAFLEQRMGYGREAVLEEMLLTLEHEGRGKIFDRVLAVRGRHDPNLVQELVEVYRNHDPNIHLEPDCAAVLGRLRYWGLKLGVLTDGLLVMQQSKILALRLSELVDATVYTDELGRHCAKPHHAGFQRLLQLVGVRPEEALFVGNDLDKDVCGARMVGMEAIHLSRGGEQVNQATHTIRQLADLLPLVSGRLSAAGSGKACKT